MATVSSKAEGLASPLNLSFYIASLYTISVLLILSSVGAMIVEGVVGGWLLTPLQWILTLAGIAIGSLGFQLVRTLRIWSRYNAVLAKDESRLDDIERRISQSGFRELYYYLVGTQVLIAGLVFWGAAKDSVGLIVFDVTAKSTVDGPNLTHIAILMCALGFSYLPVFVSTWLQAAAETRKRQVPLLRSDVVSPMTFLILSVGTLLIVLLAWAAGSHRFVINNNFGVIVIVAVMAAFALFILAPHIAKYIRDRREEAGLYPDPAATAGFSAAAPAMGISILDSILVRFIAPLSGATQNGVPHLLVLAIVIAMSALGYVLATPFGLIPIGFAILLVISLGRRWAWVEEDRETASRLETQNGNQIHIGFSNDLKDEALLGYASLFILVPLVLYQLQSWTGVFVETGSTTGNPFFDWLRFFGAELAKAVPFVDWWEIYSVDIDTPFDASKSPALAKHLTFASRAVVDLVIMAALFQALSIWQRSRAQHRLYDAGHLNAFDPFTERAFFQSGIYKDSNGDYVAYRSFKDRVNQHVTAREKHQGQRLPYSHRRLSELICSSNRELREGASWMIDKFDVLAGGPQVQLGLLQSQFARNSLPLLAARPTAANRKTIHAMKADLERITQDFLDDFNLTRDTEVGQFADILKSIKGAPEMAYGHLLIIQLLSNQTTELAALVLADHLIQDRHIDKLVSVMGRMNHHMMGRPNLFQEQMEMRLRVYDALEAIATNQRTRPIAVRIVRDTCSVMAIEEPLGDRSAQARRRAQEILEATELRLA